MQLFFNTPSSVSYGVVKYAQWNYVREGLLRNLQTIQSYYYSRVFSVKSNHFLSRLVNNINVSHKHQLERYYDIVDAKANAIAAIMKMTSSLQRGALFNGVFYGQGCTEVIMVDSSSFDPFEAYKNWKIQQAVKVVMHPRSDLTMLLPNGKTTGTETGLAVISVNIPLLAIQFRAFAAEQMKINEEGENGLQTVSHFIHRFVLPNMMSTHLDYAIFNRIRNLVNGTSMGESLKQHPFVLIDLTNQVNKVHVQLVEDMVGKTLEYKSVLATIPAVTKPTMEEVLVIPENASTRQVLWAEVLSRIDALQVIIKLAGEQSVGKNIMFLNLFAREFRQYQQDKAIFNYLPKDIYSDTFYEMQKIADLTNKKLIM